MRSAVSFAILLVLAFLCISGADAQSRTNATGTGGIHEIRGRIYLPSGRSMDTSIEVELQGSFTSLKVYTDRNGGYSFQNLAPGNYTVIVNASEEFDTVREYTTIDNEIQGTIRMMPIPKIITVPVYLQFKRGGRNATFKNEVINAKWASVPREAVERYRGGLELINANKPDQATAEFRKSIQISPSFAPAHTALGKLYLVTGKLDEALPELEAAIRYDDADFDARLNYGVALLNKKNLSEAEKALTQAANLNKTAVTPRYYLGILFIETKNLDAAQREMELARELVGSRSFPLLHRYLGGIYMAKRLNKEAVAELETYLNQEPNPKDADRIKQTIADLKSKQN